MSMVKKIPGSSVSSLSILQQKPLIILLGWLGCKERTLHRYMELYQSLGCQVITRILPPALVIQAVHSPLSPIPTDIYHRLSLSLLLHQGPIPTPPTTSSTSSCKNITDFAIHILQDVISYNYPPFMIHNFSNGGCFLFEKIYQILQFPNSQQQQHLQNHLKDKQDYTHPTRLLLLQQQCRGIIFDSSPAAFHHRLNLLDSALMHIPTTERLQLKLQKILSSLSSSWYPGKRQKVRLTQQQRSKEFWNTMMYEYSWIPQLYIYSKMDHLTDYQELEKLILYRKTHHHQQQKQQTIYTLPLEDSPHCGHLLQYPQEYRQAIQSFLDVCLISSSDRDIILRKDEYDNKYNTRDTGISLFSKL